MNGSRIPSDVNQANLKPLQAPFHNVVELRLIHCTFQTSSCFLLFIAAFPNIQTLHLSGVRLIDTDDLHVIPSNAPRPTLRKLVFFESSIGDEIPFFELFGNWLCTLSVDVLQTIKLVVYIHHEAPGICLQPILKALGAYLHHLTIDSRYSISAEECVCFDPIRTFESDLDSFKIVPALSYCTSLKTLLINQRSHDWSFFLGIMKSIHASTVSHVTIRFSAISYLVTDYRLFSSIDETLSQTRFRDIQTVKLVLYGNDTLTPRDIQSLHEKLPSLAIKGLIKFEELNEWW
ncbi:hypothetical protein NLI96_g7298 [Meripilus lineatus]|uniref:Uncharacterized protein n=1 Tax=Meripilus lineatus TaxID=2056292 RepID=A0AAD5YF56_9APHY|nr:hypothetical protein NLI96_g7298 [Physisporinus lineatus]